MAPLETHRAHCGACGGLMMLRIGVEGVWFVCVECWEETTPRATVVEADDDVVWVEVPQSVRNERDRRKFSA
jgi:hypothetical protein